MPQPEAPSRPTEGPVTRSFKTGALFLGLTAALCLAHGWAIWLGMDGWEGLTSEWPLWRDDHPLYFHSALVTRDFLRQSGTTAGYDPAFMAGYAKSVVFPASSTLPELVVAFFGGARPEVAYKAYVFVAASLVPWLLAAAAMVWKAGPVGTFVTVLAGLVYLWTDFPINYAAFGMLPYLLAVPLGLVATGAFARFIESRRPGWWAASAVLMVLAVLVHLTSAMVAAPAAALVYLVGTFRGRWLPEERIGAWTHVGVWTIPVLVLALNAFWWLPGTWLASTKGPSDFAFTHPEGALVRLRQIVTTEPAAERWLWAGGVLGFVALARRPGSGPRLLGLLGFAGAGFFWGYLAGDIRALDFLQPGRHTYALYSALAVAFGIGVARALERLRPVRIFRLDVIGAALLTAAGWWQFGEAGIDAVRYRVATPFPFLSSRPSPVMLWVMSRVGRHVKPGERLLYEEGGFAIPEAPDPFQGGRFSGLLPWKFGVEVIGGPYLHASLTTNFTQFGEARLFGRERWDRDWFVKYARLYRPSAVVCWSPWAMAFCRSNPDLVEVIESNGLLLVGRVKGFEGPAVTGRARVSARPGRLEVRVEEAGIDGSVVLGYHSVPCLRPRPPVAWESVFLEGDPVPFIKLRPPPGTVTYELTFPPPP